MSENQNLKDRIIDIAYLKIKQSGFKSMKIDDLAKELSISKKTIYEHFTSKKDIFIKVINQHKENFNKELDMMVSRFESKDLHFFAELRQISKLIKIQISFFTEDLLKDVNTYIPEYYEKCEEFGQASRNKFKKIISISKNNNYLKDDIDPDIYFLIHRSSVEALTNSNLLNELPYSSDQILDKIFDILYLGILRNEHKQEYNNFFKESEN